MTLLFFKNINNNIIYETIYTNSNLKSKLDIIKFVNDNYYDYCSSNYIYVN